MLLCPLFCHIPLWEPYFTHSGLPALYNSLLLPLSPMMALGYLKSLRFLSSRCV